MKYSQGWKNLELAEKDLQNARAAFEKGEYRQANQHVLTYLNHGGNLEAVNNYYTVGFPVYKNKYLQDTLLSMFGLEEDIENGVLCKQTYSVAK